MRRIAKRSPYLRARLRRLEESIDGRSSDAEQQLRRLRVQRALNEALLAEAIDEAEHQSDRLARGLAAFDRRARLRVDWLRAIGSVRATMVWDPSATRTPEVSESSPRRRAERGRPHRTLTPRARAAWL